MSRPTWRQMCPSSPDIKGLIRVADAVHPSLPESDFVFSERAALFPEGCLVLVTPTQANSTKSTTNPSSSPSSAEEETEEETTIVGYAISHPIPLHSPPDLDTLLGSLPGGDVSQAQYYIHDVAILPEYRGRGLAAEAVSRLLGVAQRGGWGTSCLVSVYGTAGFWGKFGFVRPNEVSVDEVLREKVADYGDDAVYLVRKN